VSFLLNVELVCVSKVWFHVGCYVPQDYSVLRNSVERSVLPVSGQSDWCSSRWLLREQRSRLGFLTLEDGTDRLFRNVGKELPLLAA
jgi:hypothetical protein